MWKLFFLFIAMAVSAVGAPMAEPDELISYKKVGGVELKMHVFYPPDYQPSDKRPAMVFFFGGGWKTGSPSHFYDQSAYFASRGMVVLCPEYRTETANGTSPKECVKDAKSAMRWVKIHAPEMGVDPEKIAAGGGSAGGHLAAAVALVDGFSEEGEDLSVSCVPKALVLFNPVFDNGPDGYGYERVGEYWQAFSPMNNIDKDAPPTLVMLGGNDKLIPVATAQEYKRRMDEAGVRCELSLYGGMGHGFFNKKKYYETLLETDKFLESLGFLKGEPTLKRGDR